MGRSEAGKTSLTQALRSQPIEYQKTQYVTFGDVIIDTPGEYIENPELGRALALYSYEADVVGLLISATEPFSLYPPAVTPVCNRDVIGIITKINDAHANVAQAESWLSLAGCSNIFKVDSQTGEGVWQILEYLKEDGDVMPWEEKTV